MKLNFRRKNKGFSLVELMIAMALGAFMLLMIVSVFAQSNRATRQDDQVSIIQENGRFAIRNVTRSLSLGGFWGGLPDPSLITVDAAVGVAGCDGWVLTVAANSISVLNEATAAQVGAFPCVDTSNFEEDTDVLAVLRVADSTAAALQSNGVYLAANAASGTLFQGTTVPAAPVAPASVWRYVPEIFYIVDNPDAAGNAIPTLCKYELNESTSAMERQCLADGVENMQVEFGIDEDGDFIADYYTEDPPVALMNSAVSAKVYFLIRSVSEIAGYTNTKNYNLGSTVIPAANDGYLRRVFSATVVLKNSPQLTVVPI